MPIDLSNFELSSKDTDSGLAIYERDVTVPFIREQLGSNYDNKESVQTAYRAGRDIFKVSEVSDRGWTVWHYEETDDGIETRERVASKLNAQDAQRIGKRRAMEVTI